MIFLHCEKKKGVKSIPIKHTFLGLTVTKTAFCYMRTGYKRVETHGSLLVLHVHRSLI